MEDNRSTQSDESTPLLGTREDAAPQDQEAPAAPAKRRLQRWPSILALSVLCAVVVVILLAVFLAPEMLQEYAREAAVFEPTSLSVDSFTQTGITARLQGDFSMDASRVKKPSLRDVGKLGSWIARQVETSNTKVEVSLPEYGGVVLGTATIPSLRFNVRNGHTTHMDFLSDLEPGPPAGLRRIASDWVDGRLGQLRVQGVAKVGIKSGIFSLGSTDLTHSFVLDDGDIPSIPEYNITNINVHEGTSHGLDGEAALVVGNRYPVDLKIPSLGFSILAPSCPSDPRIKLANAVTSPLHVRPRQNVHVHVTASIQELPSKFTKVCQGSKKSPLDDLIGDYLHGEETTLYVKGSRTESTPQWVSDLTSGITVPVPFTGGSFEHVIRNFTLDDVQFDLPDFFAEPGSPQAQPKVSGVVKALIDVPDQVNFGINVPRLRATVDILYKSKKLGYLDLHKWLNSSTSEVGEDILVEAVIKKAPVNITDNDVFGDVIQNILAGSGTILHANATVDVEVQTALGQFVVRDIPAEGDVPVNTINGTDLGSFAPAVNELRISETAEDAIRLHASINFTNPTNYSASIPYLAVNISVNGTLVGHGTVENVNVTTGNNTNVELSAVWEPLHASGPEGRAIGREFISQYISGYNTSVTVNTFSGTIPADPGLGRALSSVKVEIPTPRVGAIDPDDPSPRFIQDTTMHLVSSTARFTLNSPLSDTTLYLTYINATARYHGDVVGKILYDGFIEVPPGVSETPRLPVDWSLGSVGYDAVKNALGGRLKVNATAVVGIRVGHFEERLWYSGRGIGANIRL